MHSSSILVVCMLAIYSRHSCAEKVEQVAYQQVERLQQEGESHLTSCPLSCHCSSPERVDCGGADLGVVPVNISRLAVYLLLNENRLEFLSSKSFDECPRVRTLDLQHNRLSDDGLPQRAFAPLRNLHHLYLTGNRLQKVPEGLPDTLVTLHLSGNEIKKIDPLALALKQLLRHLYLHDNKLTSSSLCPKVFKNLTSLEEVTLSNNELSTIPSIPTSAELIYLQSNTIRDVPQNIFRRRRKIRLLFLQKNHISDEGIARKSFAGLRRVEYIDLSDNNLTTIPRYLPTKVKRLHLERNRIANVSKQALDRLRRVESLLLHQNHIRSSDIENRAFSKLHRLRTLHIFRNKLTTVPHHLPRNLQALILLSNDISSISVNAFKTSKKLRELDMRYNKLTNRGIERGALRNLKALQQIDFCGNKLRAVPVLPRNLTKLFLAENHISRIPPHSLSRIPQLRHLTLRGNKLRNEGIPGQVFHSSTELETLDLSENHLTAIPRNLPVNVVFLYLQSNYINVVGQQAFKFVPKLRVVNLQYNQLLPDTVSRVSFTNLGQLRYVYMSWRPRETKLKLPPEDGQEQG